MIVRVRAPATTANLGPGFDCAGAALELWNELELSPGDSPVDRDHLGVRAFERLAPADGWSFQFTDNIPQARGLGSSASVIALGLVAAAIVTNQELTADELLALGLELEGHGDNLAAALVGGVCLTWGTRIARIADTAPATPVAVIPAARGLTAESRAALPATVPHADAAFSAGRAALLGAALASRSTDLFEAALEDRLHEPYRAESAPLLGQLREHLPAAARRRDALRRRPDGHRLGAPRRRGSLHERASIPLPERARSPPDDLPDRSRPDMTENPYDRPSDPAKRQSAALTDGADRAPARAMLKGTGFTDEDLARPLIGVATSWIETMPCNLNQRALAQHVKRGIRDAGGTPMEFNTIAVSDGVSMGTEGMRASLVSREVIADSIELVVRGHMFDGLVCLVGCDKTIPAAVMALARLDLPGLALYNGSIAPGRYKGADVHDPGRLRGGRRARCGHDERRGGARARKRRLSRRGRLRRAVHGEHDVDGARLPRYLPGRPERDPGAAPVQGRRRLRGRRARDAARAR